MESDRFTPKPGLLENSLFGQLLPFSILSYLDPQTNTQYQEYRPGTSALYVKDIKLADPDGPFILVYASPSFSDIEAGSMNAVLIYKVNHEYTQ